ncbi:hypothetical protein HDU76_000561, partial [Blyttiomyces sp. JEL0837]
MANHVSSKVENVNTSGESIPSLEGSLPSLKELIEDIKAGGRKQSYRPPVKPPSAYISARVSRRQSMATRISVIESVATVLPPRASAVTKPPSIDKTKSTDNVSTSTKAVSEVQLQQPRKKIISVILALFEKAISIIEFEPISETLIGLEGLVSMFSDLAVKFTVVSVFLG